MEEGIYFTILKSDASSLLRSMCCVPGLMVKDRRNFLRRRIRANVWSWKEEEVWVIGRMLMQLNDLHREGIPV